MVDGIMGIAVLLRCGDAQTAQTAQVVIRDKGTSSVSIGWQVGDVLVLHENFAVESQQGEIELLLIPFPMQRLEKQPEERRTEDVQLSVEEQP